MNTIHLSDPELEMVRHAMHAYLGAFGHNEAETLHRIKELVAKLDAAGPDDEEPRFIA